MPPLTMEKDKFKWIRGTKKAFVRAPHMLLGQKSEEDTEILVWTKDFHASQCALQNMQHDTKQLVHQWKAVFERNTDMITAFLGVYQDIEREEDEGLTVKTSQNTVDRVRILQTDLVRLTAQMEAIVDELSRSVDAKLMSARDCIKNVEQLLTKRSHKKIDFDRYVAARQRALRSSDIDAQRKAENEIQKVKEAFSMYNARIHDMVPKFLTLFDHFVQAMLAKIAFTSMKLYDHWRKFFFEACATANISEEPESFETIHEHWQKEFSEILPVVEALDVLRSGIVVKQSIRESMIWQDSALSHAQLSTSNAFSNLTNRAYTQWARQPVEFYDEHTGMFGNAEEVHANVEARRAEQARKDAESNARNEALDETAHELSEEPFPVEERDDGPREYVVATADFSGEEGELHFMKGDIIQVLDHGGDGDDKWWLGVIGDQHGLFPYNYVKPREAIDIVSHAVDTLKVSEEESEQEAHNQKWKSVNASSGEKSVPTEPIAEVQHAAVEPQKAAINAASLETAREELDESHEKALSDGNVFESSQVSELIENSIVTPELKTASENPVDEVREAVAAESVASEGAAEKDIEP